MGNYRFRFSDILPNAWFYKLARTNNVNNNVSTTNNRKPNKKLLQPQPPPPPPEITKLPLPPSDHRKSYHFTRERETIKSSGIRTRRRTDDGGSGEKGVAVNDSDFDGPRDLPPIITKKQNQSQRGLAANSTNSPGVRLRGKVVSRRVSQGRRSGSWRRTESFAVVKRSEDPGKDFRESMVEMIAENNIRASKDLEELLACYLSLNSDEYHQVIIDVFKQIWFEKKRK